MSEKVFVAMSGGVDSSVAAYLLKEAGYDVSAIHLELSPPAADHSELERTCQLLGIPLHYLHLEKEFRERVIDYFCEEYSRGRTPNPCVRCNKNFKFGLLLDKVKEMGGDYLATGHYARVEKTGSGCRLLKGIDPVKDQSYFLYALGQAELKHILFPIGGMLKSEVKKLAADKGLPAWVRKESQDICFIPDDDSRAFLSAHITGSPGEIVDLEGKVLGRHRGLAFYTVGQRQGMGISAAGRLYVVRLEAGTNRLMIGPDSALFKKRLIAYNLSWISGKAQEGKVKVMAKVRYRSAEAEAIIEVKGDRTEVVFTEPQRALTPGQSVVFYVGESVLGGGIIGETE
jgi:tRNA-specific 2-thiouridylase